MLVVLRDAHGRQRLRDQLLDARDLAGEIPANLARRVVKARHRAAVRNGMPLRPEWLDASAQQAEAQRVYVGGEFAGIGAPREDGSVRFRAMLLK